jgi:hypothetical protein
MGFRKGQASVENLAMVATVAAVVIPIILFVLSVSSSQSSSFYQRHVYESMDILKRNIEEVYAFCPGERQFYVYLPQMLNSITFTNSSNRAMLTAVYTLDSKQNSFSVPVNTVNSNNEDYEGQIYIKAPIAQINQIIGGGIVRVSVNCSVSESDPKTIDLYMVDKRGR